MNNPITKPGAELAARDAVAQLLERDRVRARITELFLATDAKDWARVARCFAPIVAFDLSSVGGPSAPTAVEDIVAGWRTGLAPIEAVHHQASNFVISVTGARAEAHCYGIAYHYRKRRDGRNTRVFVGSYDFGLERFEDVGEASWRISMMRFTLKFMDGNPTLEIETSPTARAETSREL